MRIISDATLTSECLRIDDTHFINCTLVDCILEYSGGDVIFDRTVMRGCRHVFFGRARRTLHYVQRVGLMPYDPAAWGEFSETVQ